MVKWIVLKLWGPVVSFLNKRLQHLFKDYNGENRLPVRAS